MSLKSFLDIRNQKSRLAFFPFSAIIKVLHRPSGIALQSVLTMK